MKKYIIYTIVFTMLCFDSINTANAKEDSSKDDNGVIPGIVIAKVKPGINFQVIVTSTELLAISKINQAFPHHSSKSDLSRIYNIYINPDISPEEFAAELSNDKIFEYVEPKYLSYISETIPNDTLLGQQFYLSQVNMFNAWDIQQGSPEIIIAIIDNGTDYRHPDLVDNIWINQAEAQGKPGVDDDGNGYIDDIHGWDFGENDNDPIFGTDEARVTVHGTHTAGIASAVTNNITGVAGIGWQCKIMPIKTSEDEATRLIPFGYEGIVYAAANGAHIINNSWGRGGNYSQYEQDIINYAVINGSIVVGAAGNSNQETMFYPAGYVHVIAVAAVNETDQKATYSNFGKFVDVSAPGGDFNAKILNTFPVERGSYGELSGTSMASPVVAGIMGLLMNQFPAATRLQLSRRIILAADNIDELNPDHRGLLGYGRVNAFGTLTEDIQEEEPARITFFKAAANDSVWGNGNFLFERHETIGIDGWYRNFAISSGKNFVLTLSSDDNDLIITQSRVTIDEVPPDSIFTVRNQLKFLIKPDAKSHLTKLVLKYSLDNGIGGSDTLFSIIGKSSVLLVDDDNGRRNVEAYYTAILDHLQVPYLRWDHFRLGTPSPKTLTHFPTVIWFCEWAFPGLDIEDRIAIQHFLNQNGNLFISGQDIGWDLADPASDRYSERAVQFYQEYLHSEYKADNSRSSNVIGIPGTIGQGFEFDIFQPRISVHSQYPEWIEPTDDAQSCFRYDNEKGAGISYKNSNKVLNLGFGFEAVDASSLEDPFRISRHRLELMQRILNKLGPLSHTPIDDMEQSDNPLAIRMKLSSLVNDHQSLSLFWKTDSMSNFSSIAMTDMGNHVFQQHLNLKSYLGKVYYYFQMATPYYQFNLPITGEKQPYSFHIGIDRTPPQFFHIPLKDVFIQHNGRNAAVFVKDNISVDTSSVWLHYKSETEEDSVLMILEQDHWYQSLIPPISLVGDSIQYYFSAGDRAQVPNRSISKMFSYKIGVEDFEYGMDFWKVDSTSWQIDDREFYSGKYCISSFPGQAYPNNSNISLQSKFGLKRKNLKDRVLTLWTKYELEENKDFGFVEISIDNGEIWQTIGNAISGVSDGWNRRSYDLNHFYDETEDTLLLRFRMQTDSSQIQPLAGWFIDDITIHSKGALAVPTKEMTNQTNLPVVHVASNSPNPFNATTRITYQLSVSGKVIFEVYNLRGQLVTKRSLGFQQAGKYDLIWDGTDIQGNLCESGIYFGRLIVKSSNPNSYKKYSKTLKMIYVK